MYNPYEEDIKAIRSIALKMRGQLSEKEFARLLQDFFAGMEEARAAAIMLGAKVDNAFDEYGREYYDPDFFDATQELKRLVNLQNRSSGDVYDTYHFIRDNYREQLQLARQRLYDEARETQEAQVVEVA